MAKKVVYHLHYIKDKVLRIKKVDNPQDAVKWMVEEYTNPTFRVVRIEGVVIKTHKPMRMCA